jgi:hypothetical protein
MFGALCLTFLAPIAIKLGFNEKFAAIAPLVPWFAWCILPLALSNVFIGHFIARGQFRVTSILVVVAVAYLFTLIETVAPVTIPVDTLDEGAYLMPKFKQVVKTLGVFNLILLAVASTAYLVTRERDPAKSAV